MAESGIRVLHVGKYYPPVPGGIEQVVRLLCENERPAIDSRALVSNTRHTTIEEVVEGVPVTRLARVGYIGSVGLCPTLPLWLRRLPADVIVVHEPNPIALVAVVLARPNTAILVWFHSEVVRPRWKYRLLYRPFLRAVLRRAARIVVSSPALAQHALELQDFQDKCVVVPYGVDRARFAPTARVLARAERIRAEHPGPLILFVGRLVPYKGVDVLLRALDGLDATTLLVGDGPLRAALEAQADALGLSRVRFLGAVPDEEVASLYHAADIFTLPSVTRAEAFGVVQLEAMACGVPVVSTRLPSGVPWVNQHEQTGLVVPPGDATALHEALATLLRDPALRNALGRSARARVDREFTPERMARMTGDIYREVLGRERLVPLPATPQPGPE